MQISTKDNNEFLLIPGTDQPQRDGEGQPVPNPNFGQISTTTLPDPPAVPAVPAVLSGVAFNKHAAGKLAGGGIPGMARFMAIMDAGRAAGGAAAFAVNQYEKAQTFSKAEVQAFGAVLAGAGCMTANEVSAIAGDDWPAA